MLCLGSVVLGSLLTFSYEPFGQWWLSLLILPTWLCLSVKYATKPFLTAWCFGFGFFGAGISWVHVSIATFGGVPLIVSIVMMAILCGYLALFVGIFYSILQRYFAFRLWPLAAPFIWLLCEWLRANMLSGFPWLSIGYSQSTGPLAAFYPVIGEIGLSALMILLAVSLALAFAKPSKINTVSSLSLYAVTIISTFLLSQQQWVTPNDDRHTIALVQGNIEQSLRWRPEQDKLTMQKYVDLTAPYWHADIVIWPEAAIPRLESLATDYLLNLEADAIEHSSALITGIVDYQYEGNKAFNKLITLGLSGTSSVDYPYEYPSENSFAKHQLLPIGEFVPFENLLRPLAPIFDLPMSSFSRGDYVQQNLEAKGLQLTPAICYEIVFGQQIAANITTQTDAIVTVSNDAWFGDSHGPHQHLQIAQVRAMEFGIPVIRATNNGLTAAFDHQGKLLGILPQFKADVLELELSTVEGSTPYLKVGNYPVYIFFSLCFITAIWLRLNNK